MSARLTQARRAALDVLGEQRRRNARARELLRSSESMKKLSARDRAFVTRLVLGVVSTQGTLDAAIANHLRKNRHLEPRVRDALRISTYEMLFLGTEPAVAVSQGVSLVRAVCPRAAGLANAVLRRVAELDVPSMKAALVRVRMGLEPAVEADVAEAAGGADAAGAATVASDAPSAAAAAAAEMAKPDVASHSDGIADPTPSDLALVAGVPSWVAKSVVRQYGVSQACRWALSLRVPAPPFVASNLRVIADQSAQGQLRGRCYAPQATGLVGSWRLQNAAHLATTSLVDEAQILPADLATQLVARIAAPAPGQRVLEVGQGRATKSILMLDAALRLANGDRFAGASSADSDEPSAEASNKPLLRPTTDPRVSLVGVDVEKFKCKVATERLQSAGWGDCSESVCLDARLLAAADAADADGAGQGEDEGQAQNRDQSKGETGAAESQGQELPASLRAPFDVVLVDAPCSGVGTIRRHPEVAWSLARKSVQLKSGDVAELPQLQLALLQAAAHCVRPGGTLVYATCSFLREEDEDVLERFLMEGIGANFVVAPVAEAPAIAGISDDAASWVQDSLTPEGYLRIHPSRRDSDLHFCARLVRRP